MANIDQMWLTDVQSKAYFLVSSLDIYCLNFRNWSWPNCWRTWIYSSWLHLIFWSWPSRHGKCKICLFLSDDLISLAFVHGRTDHGYRPAKGCRILCSTKQMARHCSLFRRTLAGAYPLHFYRDVRGNVWFYQSFRVRVFYVLHNIVCVVISSQSWWVSWGSYRWLAISWISRVLPRL